VLQAFTAEATRVGLPIDFGVDRAPTPAANPAVAALPDGRYAVAFTDGTSGTPDVVLRSVDPDASDLGDARTAHAGTSGFQQDVDLVWAGDALIVAWTDLLDLRYRRFDAELRPLGEARALAQTPAIESSVSLAAFDGGFAAAFRANDSGFERIHVVAGDAAWSTPPAEPGPIGDRPALVALDDTHLLLLYTVGTDPLATGSASVGRLRAAVLSTEEQGEVDAAAWSSLLEPYASDTTLAQRRPSAARVGERVYVAWESTSPLGSGEGTDAFVARVELDPDGEMLVQDTETTLPFGFLHPGAQRNPRIAASPLFPEGAVIALWEDVEQPGGGSTLTLDFRPSPFVTLAP